MERRSVLLFSLGSAITGSPIPVPAASYQVMGVKELQDIERWIKQEPTLLGDEFLIVASQFSKWDKSKDRPDLIVLDRNGKLGVVEIKRDQSGSGQDLQAIRYAAYASTLTVDEVIELYREHAEKTTKQPVSTSAARDELASFVAEREIDEIDEDDQPRIILVAGGFQPGVTSTAIWLRQSFDMDVTCVQIQPYMLKDEVLLTSTTIIPVPEAADFEVKVQAKKQQAKAKATAPLDFDLVAKLIEAIPTGRWSSYGNVARAAGSPRGAMGLGSMLLNSNGEISSVHRVLNFRGEVSPGWKATDPGLPPTPEAVQEKLESEGIVFDDAGRAAQSQRWTTADWGDLAAIAPADAP